MKIAGRNGEIELLEEVLVIRKKGMGAFILQGSKGDKRIPYSSITAIQLRKPGLMTAGYFQVTIAGGVESRRGLVDATKDENTVMFNKSQLAGFLEAQSTIERKSAASRRPGTAQSAEASPMELLKKLGDLRDAGTITLDEFEAKKVELLGRI